MNHDRGATKHRRPDNSESLLRRDDGNPPTPSVTDVVTRYQTSVSGEILFTGTQMNHGTSSAVLWIASLFFMATAIPTASAKDNSRLLGVVGYNYTNQDIGDFEVAGVGGGLVSVSNEHSGGGGIACCIRWHDGTQLPRTFRVRWDADRCRFTTPPNDYGETVEATQHFYREAEIELEGPVPEKPQNFEVHFYPDGHIELAIAKGSYTPRLKLDPKRELPIRRCAADEQKQ